VPQELRCKKYAAWRIHFEKPAKRLSMDYCLDCEYGSWLMTFWQGAGGGPLYLCDEHARILGFAETSAADSLPREYLT